MTGMANPTGQGIRQIEAAIGFRVSNQEKAVGIYWQYYGLVKASGMKCYPCSSSAGCSKAHGSREIVHLSGSVLSANFRTDRVWLAAAT